MKKIILFCQLLLLINLFSQDGNIKEFNDSKENILDIQWQILILKGIIKKSKNLKKKLKMVM